MYKIENTCISFKVKNLNYFEYWELDSVIDTALISFLFDDKLINYNKWNKNNADRDQRAPTQSDQGLY